MKVATIMTVNDEDNSSVGTVYLIPDDFEIPSDWEKVDVSIFMPDIPNEESMNNAFDAIGIVGHGFTNEEEV